MSTVCQRAQKHRQQQDVIQPRYAAEAESCGDDPAVRVPSHSESPSLIDPPCKIGSCPPDEEFRAIVPLLEAVHLPQGFVIATAETLIEHVYFLCRGIGSVITVSSGCQRAEAGIFGREGFSPTSAGVGGWRALSRRLHRRSRSSHDRVDCDEIALTHDFISLMLSVRRPSVTTALHVLEGKRFIRSERGRIMIRDRRGSLRQAGNTTPDRRSLIRRLAFVSVQKRFFISRRYSSSGLP